MCILLQVHQRDYLLEEILKLVTTNACQNKQTLKKEQATTYVVADSQHFSFSGGNTRLESSFTNCQDKLYSLIVKHCCFLTQPKENQKKTNICVNILIVKPLMFVFMDF